MVYFKTTRISDAARKIRPAVISSGISSVRTLEMRVSLKHSGVTLFFETLQNIPREKYAARD